MQILRWVGPGVLGAAVVLALAFNGLNSDIGQTCATFGCFAVGSWVLLTAESRTVDKVAAAGAGPILTFAVALACLLVATLSRPGFVESGHAAAWLQAASLGAVCTAGAIVGSDFGRTRRTVYAIAVLGTAYAAACLILWQVHGQVDPALVGESGMGRFSATLRNPNAAGCVFGMFALLVLNCLFMTFSQTSYGVGRGLKGAWLGIGLMVLIGACVLTGSRASAAVALAVACVLSALFLQRTRRSGRAPLLIGAAFVAIAMMVAGPSSFGQRGLVAEAARTRLEGFTTYWNLTLTHPLLGMGPGGFRQINETAITTENVGSLWNLGAAHNAVLQAALEGGWPYALLSVAAMAMLAVTAFRGGLRSRQPLGLACLAVFVIAAACGMVDIAMNLPAILSLALFFLGLSWGRVVGREALRQDPSGRRAMALPMRPSTPRRRRRASAKAAAGS